jgi:glycosyltransferase involved in cell wall biosynthesis
MIIIASHARFYEDGYPVHGTGSEISTYLDQKDLEYITIKHSLHRDKNYASHIVIRTKERSEEKFVGISGLPFLLRAIQEQIITFYYMFTLAKPAELFIGIDPLNATSGLLARKLKMAKRAVFYTADFSPQRFGNPLMNKIYHIIDKIAAKNADQVWNVSSKIVRLREKQGIPRNKNFFLPNTPEFSKTKRRALSKIRRCDLVIVSNITKSVNFPMIIRSIKDLEKTHKKIRFLIIGDGDKKYIQRLKRLVKKLRLTNRVLFLGGRPHEELLTILARCGIGIALYSRSNPWVEFGDSMKAREYMAVGLPVVITDVPSTAEDIKKSGAGFVIHEDKKSFQEAIDKILSNRKLYTRMRKNAIRLAKETNFTDMFENLLKKLGVCK